MKKCLPNLFVIITILAMCCTLIQGQAAKKGSRILNSNTAGTPSNTMLNINNIATIFYNDGKSDITQGGDCGFTYPKGTGKNVFFQSGLLWGGKIDNYWAVGGTAYRTGLKPGRILENGTTEDPNAASVRVYRVRSDYKNFTDDESKNRLFASEIALEGKTVQEIYAQYELDWNQWPAQYGAPFIDVDKNGIYNPAVDIPGMSESPCQTIWFAANDLDPSVTQYLYGSLPMGVELQGTIWAINGIAPLGNTVFRRYRLINKNSRRIDSMDFCMWSDPDLGTPYDDLCGCDTILNLGYVYNGSASDATYGTTPPAAGFTVLQGPVVPGNPGDIANFKMRSINGYKNLGMSAFFIFSAGVNADYSDPTQGNYSGTTQLINLFKGRLSRSGTPFTDYITGRHTKYMLTGDPVTGAGWVDGVEYHASDRRMGIVSGSFTMNPGDTQEVIFAQAAAGVQTGIDRFEAISFLKSYSKALKYISDNNFSAIEPPPAPVVSVSKFDNAVLLSWSNAGAYETSENWNKGNFKFEGYNIYQLPAASAQLSEGKRIATYDIVNNVTAIVSKKIDEQLGVIINSISAYGTDSGIYRYIKITEDKLRGISALYNGRDYYFAVTAYGYNPDADAIPNYLESTAQIITATPQSEPPGTRFALQYGDTLSVNHTYGSSEGKVIVKVVDPQKGNGGEYTVALTDDKKFNILKGTTLIQANQPVAGISGSNPIVEGAQVHVVPAAGEGLKRAQILSGTNPFDEDGKSLSLPTFSITKYKGLWNDGIQLGCNWYYKYATSAQIGSGSSLTSISQYHDVILKFANTGNDGTFSTTNSYASMGYRFMRGANNAAGKTEFAPFIINKVNYGFQEFGLNGKENIPVAAFDQVTGKRLDLAFLEYNSGSYGMVDGKYFPSKATAYATNYSGEFLFILASEYSTTAKPEYSQADREIYNGVTYSPLPIMYFIQSGRSKDAFSSNDEILIETYKLFNSADKYTFTVPAVTSSSDLAKEDAVRINVFPNPYNGLDPEALSTSEARVTFSHLPARAVIKIFNVSGQLIRTIEKSNNSQFQIWDLKTDKQQDIASGIYVAHIELPDLGKVKTLKIAILMGQQYPVRN